MRAVEQLARKAVQHDIQRQRRVGGNGFLHDLRLDARQVREQAVAVERSRAVAGGLGLRLGLGTIEAPAERTVVGNPKRHAPDCHLFGIEAAKASGDRVPLVG